MVWLDLVKFFSYNPSDSRKAAFRFERAVLGINISCAWIEQLFAATNSLIHSLIYVMEHSKIPEERKEAQGRAQGHF